MIDSLDSSEYPVAVRDLQELFDWAHTQLEAGFPCTCQLVDRFGPVRSVSPAAHRACAARVVIHLWCRWQAAWCCYVHLCLATHSASCQRRVADHVRMRVPTMEAARR